MAGQSRTLKLSILADVDQLKKSLTSANNEVDNSASRISDFSKKAAVAFAAAGAAVGAFALSAVKAAAEDETAQTKLQETIRNTTNATAEQIAGIDKYVTAQSIATATTDDVIRPALSRLLRATGDLTKSQELLTLSQEISVATGKPLEAVTNAVAKSFEGSNTALGKLGIGIDAATLKTMTFDETQQLLNKTFDGFIENQSETAAFKFKQISIAVDESKEAIGAALLPVVKELADFIIVSVVPAVESFVAGLTGQNGLEKGLTNSQKKAEEWGKKVRGVIDTVIDLKDELIATAIVIGTIFVVSKIAAGVTATIALIKTLITAYNALKASALVAGIASAFALNPLLGVGAVALAAGVLAAGNALANKNNVSTDFGSDGFAVGGAPGAISGAKLSGATTAGSGVGGGGGTTTTTAKGIATAVASAALAGGAFTDSQNAANLAAQAGGGNTDSQNGATYNITVNGAVDAESTARQIVGILNDSFYRGTGGASALQAI